MAYAIVASKPGGTEVLHKTDIDMPVPSATDVLIRQTAVGTLAGQWLRSKGVHAIGTASAPES